MAIYVDKQIDKCQAMLTKMIKSADGVTDATSGALKGISSGFAGMAGSLAAGANKMPGALMSAAKGLKDKIEGGDSEAMDNAEVVYNGTDVDTLNVQSSIDARMSLADALSDDVISTYPVSKVISTYNKLADIYPRAVLASATLIPMLRRTLANPDVEAHDITLAQKVEQGLASTQDPTKISG